MKNYIVFSGDHYYPCGGWQDVTLQTDSLDEAIEHSTSWVDEAKTFRRYEWAEILDTMTGEIVYSRNFAIDGDEHTDAL